MIVLTFDTVLFLDLENVSLPLKNKRPKTLNCTDAENIVLLEEIALEETLLASYFQNGL